MKDKLERRASWSLLRGLTSTLEALLGPGALRRCELPPGLNIARVTHGARRVDVDGREFILDVHGKMQPVIPDAFSLNGRLMIHNVVDRHSTNVSSMCFVASLPYLWTTSYGYNHDTWNAIQTTSKKTKHKQARNWDFVQKAAAVFNANHGPFRSGVWGRQKQQVLAQYVLEYDFTDDRFRSHALKQMKLDGDEDCSDERFAEYWRRLACLPSANSAGTACKFSRWMSINQCWREHRSQIWLEQLVHEEMAGNYDPTTELLAQATSQLDVIVSNDRKGLLQRIPTYICWELCDNLDIFTHFSEPWEEIYTERATTVKSPDAGLKFSLQHLEAGRYRKPYAETVRRLHDLKFLQTLGFDSETCEQDRAATNAVVAVQFVLGLLREMGVRELGAIGQPPYNFILMLSSDTEAALKARDDVVLQHAILVEAENRLVRFAAPLDSVQPLLNDLAWEEMSMIRLTFSVIKEEKRTHPGEIGPMTLKLLNTFFRKMPDEKGAEDLHQHGRDVSRQQRWKKVSMPALFNAVIESHVLDERANSQVTLSAEEIATKAWNNVESRQKHGAKFDTEPKGWPKEWNKILDPSCSYAAPVVTTIFNSMLAWRRLLQIGGARKFEEGSRSWPSRMLRHADIITMPDSSEFVVLATGRWGALVCHLEKIEGTGHRRIKDGESALDIKFILESDITAWSPLCAQAVGAPLVDVGFVLQPSEPRPLLKVACGRRHEFGYYECDRLVNMLHIDMPEPTRAGIFARIDVLLKFLFADAELEHVQGLYKGTATLVEEEPEDPEMAFLLSELAVTDPLNAGDWAEMKKSQDSQRTKNLCKRRTAERKAKEERKTKAMRLKKSMVKKVKGKVSGKKGTAPRRRQKQRVRPLARASAATVSPAPGAVVPVPSEPATAAPAAPTPVSAPSAGEPAAPTAVVPLPPPPAAAERPRPSAPKRTAGWDVFAVEGGWIRYNTAKRQGDAHCGLHAGCKMDRGLWRGTVGLSTAWLAAAADPNLTRADHVCLKEELSGPDGFDRRLAARTALVDLSMESEAVHERCLVEIERQARSGDDFEPPEIACPSIEKELERAMAAAAES